jgi:Family of unknown function (DUF6510)
MMTALDGNAAGGLLLEVFGREMTAARGTCASCGAVAALAEAIAYLRGPGTVLRCRSCTAVLVVVVVVREVACVDLRGLADLHDA